MSDIQVKALAAMVKAPVDVLMRQLKKAGIEVNSPEDKITDAQKLMLLERIKNEANSGRTETVDNRNAAAGKITLKRTTPGGAGANDRKPQGVEVRRKKTISLRNSEAEAQADRAAEQRAELLARQAESDRRTREALIEKAERERRELELQRIRRQKEAAIQAQTPPVVVPPVEVVKEPQVELVEPVAIKTADLDSVVEVIAPVTTPVVELKQSVETPVVVQEAHGELIEPDVSTEGVSSKDATPISGMEQRQIVADAARQEASDALKRRPSRAKPKQSLAPKHVIGLEDEEPAERVASPLVDTDGDDETKRGDKKKVKTRGRENERGNTPVIQHKGNKRKPGRAPEREVKHGFEKPTAPVIRDIEIPSTIIVSDLAQKLAIRATDIIKSMMKMGMMVTINQSIDQETAILVAEELGHKATPMQIMDDEAILASVLGDNSDVELEARPPVVTIMGHVDHGKTSLLDYIRKTRVASGEAGGITQHIGAYHVDTSRGTVTFLDTPGHAAFTKMRARGAQVTDIVVLIVAADDGVMPQTKEAIQHAKEANVPMVVAINKIDKPQADVDRVLNDLSQVNVLTEEWGGDVPVVRVSAKTGVGIDELLETILLVAEVQELKAPVDVPAKGTVIEASIERGRGAVATVLIREGTLRKGDILLCGTQYGRVRALFDETGRSVKEAGPSIPVAVVGLSSAPEAGDEAFVVSDERKAREIAELRQEKLRDSRFAAQNSAKLDNMFSQMQTGTRAQINLLVKADVQGSVEAIRSELLKLSTDEVEVRIISSGIGGLNESDMDLAAASKAIVVAFNVRADAGARRLAQDNDVEIRYYSIIYDVINDVRAAMSGMLSPETREVFLGLAEVRNVFRASGFGQVAGCLVVEGVVRRGNPIRVLRDNVVIYEGELESLRRHRDDVKEVQVGTECGIAVKDYNDVRVGDQIEVFEHVQVARSI